MQPDSIEVYRCTTWRFSIRNLGNIAARTELWLGVKRDLDDADTAAMLLLEETAGLIRIGGAAPTLAANGTLTVTDAVRGNIDIWVSEDETDIEGDDVGMWGIKVMTATDTIYKPGGVFAIDRPTVIVV